MLPAAALLLRIVDAQFPDLDVGSCQLCQNGQSVPDPAFEPDEAGGSTCGELEAEARDGPYYPCPVYYYFGHLCGCQNQTPPNNACKICQDSGGTVAMPDVIVDADTGQTCDSMALEAAFISEETLGYSCGYYHQFGNMCGCSNVPPAEVSCGAMCDDGTAVPNPNDTASDGRLCSVVEAEYLYNPYEVACDAGQISYDGLLCGCSNKPPEGVCGALCGPDTDVVPEPDKVVLNYATCSELNDVATWDSVSNCQVYDLYSALCGCENVEMPPPETTCQTLCQDGSSIPNPDLIVQDQSCSEYETMAKFETQLENCGYYDMLGALCGCDNEAPTDGCGKLCGDDEALPNPELEVWGQTCREWEAESTFDVYSGEFCEDTYREVKYLCGCDDVDLPTDGCGPICSDGSSLPDPDLIVYNETCSYWNLESIFDVYGVQEDYCGDYVHVGDLCGCQNEPPEDGCLLCEESLLYPDKISYDLYDEVYTCEEDANYIPFAYSRDDAECAAMRSVVGDFCGCPSAPPKKCSICPEGTKVQLVDSPSFTYTDSFAGTTIIEDENCVDVEFVINLGAEGLVDEECAEISAQIAPTCCIPDDTNGGGGGTTSSGGICISPSMMSGIVLVFFLSHLFATT